jgi:hypothetical protein
VDESVSEVRTIHAPPEAVYAILANPATHATIDGTGWVVESLDNAPLIAVGQLFRMGMFHAGHPDGRYEIVNRVEVLERRSAIAWKPGYNADDGAVHFGGWIWRYDLAATEDGDTVVTLTYDWSATSQSVRERIAFPPFPPEHLSRSLAHLAAMAVP